MREKFQEMKIQIKFNFFIDALWNCLQVTGDFEAMETEKNLNLIKINFRSILTY